MKSSRAFLAALAFLLAVPITLFYQMFFVNGAEIVVHLALASGFLFLLPFVWLLLENSKQVSFVRSLNLSVQQKETI